MNGILGKIARRRLLPQTKIADDLLIAADVHPSQIIEQAAAVAHHLQESAPGMKILRVRLAMIRQVVDPISQQRDLDLR